MGLRKDFFLDESVVKYVLIDSGEKRLATTFVYWPHTSAYTDSIKRGEPDGRTRGGGFLQIQSKERKIVIYGESRDMGKADTTVVEHLLRKLIADSDCAGYEIIVQ